MELARSMVEAGTARVLMGNHEFNAIAWYTSDPDHPGEHLRRRTGDRGDKHRSQHERFLAEVEHEPEAHEDLVGWFRSLALWLDLGEFCLVHGCWHDESIAVLAPFVVGGELPASLLVDAHRHGSPEHAAIEVVLNGPEVALPEGYVYVDKDGHPRRSARSRWWRPGATTLRDAAEIPSGSLTPDGGPFPELPDDPLGADLVLPCTAAVPVIYGHYWRAGRLSLEQRRH